MAGKPGFGGGANAIYADNGKTQGSVISVPEPGAWALMIAGMGLIGLAARRRQSALARA